MFDSQKVVDANFVASFDTPYTDLCDEIVEEFEKIIDNSKGTTHYMDGTKSNIEKMKVFCLILVLQIIIQKYMRFLQSIHQSMENYFQVLICIVTHRM